MSTHVDIDGDCPLAVVPCQYTDIGCKFKVRATYCRMLPVHMVKNNKITLLFTGQMDHAVDLAS